MQREKSAGVNFIIAHSRRRVIALKTKISSSSSSFISYLIYIYIYSIHAALHVQDLTLIISHCALSFLLLRTSSSTRPREKWSEIEWILVLFEITSFFWRYVMDLRNIVYRSLASSGIILFIIHEIFYKITLRPVAGIGILRENFFNANTQR